MSSKVKYEVVDKDEPAATTGKKRGARLKAQALEGKNEQEIDEIEHQIVRDKELVVIDEKFGEGLAYNTGRVVGEIHILVANAKQTFLEIGRRLILLKEHEGYGGFMAKLEELDFPYKSAQRMMRCALVVDSLGSKKDNLSILNQSKLLEIATLEDGDIKELGEGGSVAGVYLDDLARMTFSELRDYTRGILKKNQEEIEARERVIKQKNDKLDELDRELRGLPPKSRKEVNEAVLREQRGKFAHCITDARAALEGAVDILTKCQYLEEVDALQLNDLATTIRNAEYSMVADPMEELEELLNGLVPQEDPSARPLA
jgi:hypothetical protein